MPAVFVTLVEWSSTTSSSSSSSPSIPTDDVRKRHQQQYAFDERDFHFVLRKAKATGQPELARDYLSTTSTSTSSTTSDADAAAADDDDRRLREFARGMADRLLESASAESAVLSTTSTSTISSSSSTTGRKLRLGRQLRVPGTNFFVFVVVNDDDQPTSTPAIAGLTSPQLTCLNLAQLIQLVKQHQPRTDAFDKIRRLAIWLKTSTGGAGGQLFLRLAFGADRPTCRQCAHNPAEPQIPAATVVDARSGGERHSGSASPPAASSHPTDDTANPQPHQSPTGSSGSLLRRNSSTTSTSADATTTSIIGIDSSDLSESVKQANEARVKLMQLDKCDVFVINPMYGSRLRYECSVTYWVESRATAADTRSHHSSFSSSNSSQQQEDDGAAKWIREYPLHHAAYNNQADTLRLLIQQGHDVNRADGDSWTALHYAAFYDAKAAAGALINLGNADINVRTRAGATPFHLAAQCGNALLVELLLTAPSLEIEARDGNGRTALQLCACVPKPDWQATAKLITESHVARLPKVQIDLMDGSNLMVPWVKHSKTTAADLMQQVARSLEIDDQRAQLFGLWMCSASLELQLRPDMVVQTHLLKWPKRLQKYNPHASATAWTERPRLVFRRNPLVSVAREQRLLAADASGVASHGDGGGGGGGNATALQLLYHEAMHNYLAGLYPCSEQDAIALSALILRLVAKTELSQSKHFLNERAALKRIVPDHRLVGGAQQRQLLDRVHKEYNRLCRAAPSVTHEAPCRLKFMQQCWRFKTYGATFFTPCYLHMLRPESRHCEAKVGINDCGLHLINADNKVFLKTLPLPLTIHSSPTDRMELQISTGGDRGGDACSILSSKAEMIQLLVKKHTDQLLEVRAGGGGGGSKSPSQASLATNSDRGG